jgi:hypothetical protein
MFLCVAPAKCRACVGVLFASCGHGGSGLRCRQRSSHSPVLACSRQPNPGQPQTD